MTLIAMLAHALLAHALLAHALLAHALLAHALLAHALLAVAAAATRAHRPRPGGLIPLTCNVIARLLNRLITNPIRSLTSILNWSHWRRRHQHRARTSHYRRRPEP